MEFYVYLNGARRGPFTEERVQSFLEAGLLLPADLAADEATTDWKPLSAFQRFVTGGSTVLPTPVATSEAVLTPALPDAVLPVKAAALNASALGPYARSTLSPHEKPCFIASLHWFIYVRFALAGLALFVFAAVPFAIAVQALTGSELGWWLLPLPALLLLAPTVAFASSEFVITDLRVLIKTGIIHRKTAEVFISKVESISVDQSFMGRMFDFGTVRIRGTGGFEESFDSIAHPFQFRTWVQRLQSGEEIGENLAEPAARR